MEGINIYSGTFGLGGALTNPTELAFKKGKVQNHYPVFFRGKIYPDAERAYQDNKFAVKNEMKELTALMTDIIEEKLKQYPPLFEGIKNRGGVAWLMKCTHLVNGGRWEGIGVKSPFIACLVNAYVRCGGE